MLAPLLCARNCLVQTSETGNPDWGVWICGVIKSTETVAINLCKATSFYTHLQLQHVQSHVSNYMIQATEINSSKFPVTLLRSTGPPQSSNSPVSFHLLPCTLSYFFSQYFSFLLYRSSPFPSQSSPSTLSFGSSTQSSFGYSKGIIAHCTWDPLLFPYFDFHCHCFPLCTALHFFKT
jgi:hypothetical protein